MSSFKFFRRFLGLQDHKPKENEKLNIEPKRRNLKTRNNVDPANFSLERFEAIGSKKKGSSLGVSGNKKSDRTSSRYIERRGEEKTGSPDVKVGELIHKDRNDIEPVTGILRNTFIHLKGIGQKKESDLWMSGVLTHEEAMKSIKLGTRTNCLKASKRDLEEKNWQSFYECMNSKDHWRLFGDMMSETAYIDIETTGLGSATDIITTAVVHSAKSAHVFVNGINLDDLLDYLSRFSLIVSYNGKTFDIPFIERFFKTQIKTPHIDLRYVLASMSYKGGLKSCEKQLNLPSRSGMEDIDGYTAVLLWNYYSRTNDPKALETLLAYNFEDTVRLEWLMVEVYNRKVSELPFQTNLIEKSSLPFNPYKSSPEILRRL